MTNFNNQEWYNCIKIVMVSLETGVSNSEATGAQTYTSRWTLTMMAPCLLGFEVVTCCSGTSPFTPFGYEILNRSP